MSGFTGQTKELSGTPSDIRGLREQVASFLGGKLGGLNLGAPDIQAYKDLFTQQNKENFAQAQESAGNLTGSGLGNILGKAAGRSATSQGAFLADLLEQSRQSNANRLAAILTPFINSGVSGPQYGHQPGFLDYLFKAGEIGASAIGGGTGGATGRAAGAVAPGGAPIGAWDAQSGGWI